MRYLLPALFLLLSSVTFGADRPASCEIAAQSIVSLSASGLAQVSNLDGVRIQCRIPARPFPTKAGESRSGLKVAAAAYRISPDGRQRVPSEVHPFGGGGGGFGADPAPEWVDFDVLIPLEPADRDAEARRLIARLQKATGQAVVTESGQRRLERLRELVAQQRVGHFKVECRVMDDDRVMGVGVVEFEVLFKGRFSDAVPPVAPPA